MIAVRLNRRGFQLCGKRMDAHPIVASIDNAAERGYLAMLAARLKLDERLVAHLEQTVAATVPVKAA